MNHGFRRYLLLTSGALSAALALVGAFLPVLPTTPFILLAAACFARSSPALHRKLMENRTFGPYIEEWQRDRTVPERAKRRAYVLVVLSFSLSIYFVGEPWLRLTLGAIAVALLFFLAKLPSSPGPSKL